MSDSIFVSLHAEEFLARLQGSEGRLRANIVRVVQRLSIAVQRVVKEKLSGPVLHNKTGTLRRSINRRIRDDASGIIATVGTNVRYAAVHEYGFDGDVNVRAHTRLVGRNAAGAVVRLKKGRKVASVGVVNVRAHIRHMHLPERSFLRSTLREFGPQIRTDLKAAAMEALK